MTVLAAMREVQIPLIAALLIGASAAKLLRMARGGAASGVPGPAALFPVQVRKPLTAALCLTELGLGAGLIATAGRLGHGTPATIIRLAAGLLFLVATSALIELRATRPEMGCGCFGDFSTTPVSGRTLARSALLAVAALSTIGLPALTRPTSAAGEARLGLIMAIELIVLGALSPELSEGLVRLGYSDPCELRHVPTEATLAALRHSKQWRRHRSLVESDIPTDIWRELCWRYVLFPARVQGQAADLVFAIFLTRRRPAIQVALVDALTSQPIAWPVPQARSRAPRLRLRGSDVTADMMAAPASDTDMDLSSDL